MPEQITVRHTEPKPDHIEIRGEGEDSSGKPQMPRYARAVKEGSYGAGRNDVCRGRSHQSFLNGFRTVRARPF
jgi:hypothetical protein